MSIHQLYRSMQTISVFQPRSIIHYTLHKQRNLQYRYLSTQTPQITAAQAQSTSSKPTHPLLSAIELQHTIDSTGATEYPSQPILYRLLSRRLINRLIQYFGYSAYNNSKQLLDISSQHSRLSSLYNQSTYSIPRDYSGYMSLLTIHLWLCNVRLRTVAINDSSTNYISTAYTDTARGKQHVSAIWDLYWDRIEGDMVAHNNTYMFRSELKTIQQNVYGTCVAFDNSLMSDNKLSLIGALYRDIYRSNHNTHRLALIYMNEYIVANMNMLLSISDSDYMNLKWKFLDPNTIDIDKSPIKKNDIQLNQLTDKVVNEQIKRTYN